MSASKLSAVHFSASRITLRSAPASTFFIASPPCSFSISAKSPCVFHALGVKALCNLAWLGPWIPPPTVAVLSEGYKCAVRPQHTDHELTSAVVLSRDGSFINCISRYEHSDNRVISKIFFMPMILDRFDESCARLNLNSVRGLPPLASVV